MEDLLEVDAEPYNPKRPTVHFEEASTPLLAETRTPRPGRPGQPARYDSEYARNGTRTLCLCCEPQAGGRHSAVTAQRTKRDFAAQMQWLVDRQYPEAEVMRVGLENLTTHSVAAL